MSQNWKSKRRFVYQGNAVALGGHINHPYNKHIETQATAVLPTTGGSGRSRVENYNYKDIVTFKSATSQVSGSEEQGARTYHSVAKVTIEHLNVMDVVTADKIVGVLVSERRYDGPRETAIWPVGSFIDNLRIAGQPVDLRPRKSLFENATIAGLMRRCEIENEKRTRRDENLEEEHNTSFYNNSGDRFSLEPSEIETIRAQTDGSRSTSRVEMFLDFHLQTSLFTVKRDNGLYWAPEQLENEDFGEQQKRERKQRALIEGGQSIPVPGFGTVHIGEYLISKDARRLTMLRLELGCPFGGNIACGTVGGNGHIPN